MLTLTKKIKANKYTEQCKLKQTCKVSKQLPHPRLNRATLFECARSKSTSTETSMKSVFCELFGINEPCLLFDLVAPGDMNKSNVQKLIKDF